MLAKLMKFLGIQVNEISKQELEQENLIKTFNGIVLEKKENELIIGSQSDINRKIRLLLSQKTFLPNMTYPSLCDSAQRNIAINDISIRDRVIIEFDNDLKSDINVPINSDNCYLRLIDLDIKERLDN